MKNGVDVELGLIDLRLWRWYEHSRMHCEFQQ